VLALNVDILLPPLQMEVKVVKVSLLILYLFLLLLMFISQLKNLF